MPKNLPCFLKGFRHVVDLTHELKPGIPTWSDTEYFDATVTLDYNDGCRVMHHSFYAGIGTHIDAPAHFIKGGKTIAEIPLTDLIAPLYVIDCSDKASTNNDYLLTVDDIKAFEQKHTKILPGSIVCLATGQSKKWHNVQAYRSVDAQGAMHFPGFSVEAAAYLCELGVNGIGIDTLSPDGSNTTLFPVHHHVLGAGKFIIENLTCLESVPPVGAYILVMPLKIHNGTESPVRAVAFF